MKSEEALRYVQENLGIDLGASNFVPDQVRVMQFVQEFPFKGIVLATDQNHLLKAGRLCWELLKADKITGCIGRFESWEQAIIDHSTSFLLYTNLSEDLVKPQFVASTVRFCMQMHVPMLFTTPLSIEGLESALPVSVLSNIVPYLYGKL